MPRIPAAAGCDAERDPPPLAPRCSRFKTLGGLFMWLRLPPKVSALELLSLAARAGVTYAPGTRFFPHPLDGENYLTQVAT